MVFGEQALIEQVTRAATIKAEGNIVEFATLARNEFVGCVRKAEEAFQGKKIAFLRNLLPFQKLTRNKLNTYIPYLEKQKYLRGQTVYH